MPNRYDNITDIKPFKRKPRIHEQIAAYLSLASAFGVGKFAWDFRSDVKEIVRSESILLRPSDKDIRDICKELVTDERDRAREKESELQAQINQIAKVVVRGPK